MKRSTTQPIEYGEKNSTLQSKQFFKDFDFEFIRKLPTIVTFLAILPKLATDVVNNL